MQLGFNTNFRHRGVLFHVQTEDSGTANPHVITHLFHGGNIMASVKQDYSDRLDGADLEGSIRKLMEGMHKTMLRQLSRGEHDEAIGQRLGPDIFETDNDRAVEASTQTQAPPEPAPAPIASPPPEPAPAPIASPPPAPPTVAADPNPAAGGKESGSRLAKVFGDRVVSEKPLDEVVLDYLVENARKRKRQPK